MPKKKMRLRTMMILMLASLGIASLWNSVDFVKNAVHSVLNPSAGALLNWNITIGMFVLVFILALISAVIQKYTTDQVALKELKEEQKRIQGEIKKFQAEGNQKKAMELQTEAMKAIPETIKLSMASAAYTMIPFILFYRWFWDYFSAIPDFRFFGFLSWFWFYLIFLMIFGGFIRKWLKVA